MKNSIKALLALSLVFSLGLSAMEDKTGKPVKQSSTLNIAASVAASALAVVAMTKAMEYINDEIIYKHIPRKLYYLQDLASLGSKIGMVELSNYLIEKAGLKTNKLYLGLTTFNSIFPSLIKTNIESMMSLMS